MLKKLFFVLIFFAIFNIVSAETTVYDDSYLFTYSETVSYNYVTNHAAVSFFMTPYYLSFKNLPTRQDIKSITVIIEMANVVTDANAPYSANTNFVLTDSTTNQTLATGIIGYNYNFASNTVNLFLIFNEPINNPSINGNNLRLYYDSSALYNFQAKSVIYPYYSYMSETSFPNYYVAIGMKYGYSTFYMIGGSYITYDYITWQTYAEINRIGTNNYNFYINRYSYNERVVIKDDLGEIYNATESKNINQTFFVVGTPQIIITYPYNSSIKYVLLPESSLIFEEKSYLLYHVYDQIQGIYLSDYIITIYDTVTNENITYSNVKQNPFDFNCIKDRIYHIYIQKNGYYDEILQNEVCAGYENFVFMRKISYENVGYLSVFVSYYYTQNKTYPLSNAIITVYNDTFFTTGVTNENGIKSFALSEGNYAVKVSKTGFKTKITGVTVNTSQTSSVSIILEPEITITPTPYVTQTIIPTETISLPKIEESKGFFEWLKNMWKYYLHTNDYENNLLLGIFFVFLGIIITASIVKSPIAILFGASIGYVIGLILNAFPLWSFFAIIIIAIAIIVYFRGEE